MSTLMAESSPLLTVSQAAAQLQVNVDTIRRWCRQGALPCIFLSNRAGYRIRQADLDTFIASKRGEHPKP